MAVTQLALDVLRDEPRTYGRLEKAAGGWQVSQLAPHVAIRFKQIFPRVPKGSPGPFLLPDDPLTAADLVWFTHRYAMDIRPRDAAQLRASNDAYVGMQAELGRIALPDYCPPTYTGLRDGFEIRPYQAQAIEIAARSKGLLLGDDCGLGKTVTAAGFCLGEQRLPAAVVCQVHIQRQWGDVLTRFTTLRVHLVTKAQAYTLPEADVYVFRYSQLAGWVSVFDAGIFRTAIYDEPQELRTGTGTAKGGGARVLSEHATWRLGLTATPIYNYGSEIWNILRFIDKDALGNADDFAREYTGMGGRLRDPKALGSYLRERYVFLRRTKADVGMQMPAVNRIVDFVSSDEKAVLSIEAEARALAMRATTGSFTERGTAARELDLLVRHATGVGKARGVAAVVRILVESGEPVLLVGWHRDVYTIWLEQLADLKPAMYTGTESPAQKAKAKEAFCSGATSLLIMSLRSAAGLDGLQSRCSTVVFGELDWSPGVHHQVIERVDRDGQTRPVMAMFLVSEDGSDPPMMELLGLKASEAQSVIDPMGGAETVDSDTTRLQALVARYLKGKAG